MTMHPSDVLALSAAAGLMAGAAAARLPGIAALTFAVLAASMVLATWRHERAGREVERRVVRVRARRR